MFDPTLVDARKRRWSGPQRDTDWDYLCWVDGFESRWDSRTERGIAEGRMEISQLRSGWL